jgi:hypothetical protein
MTIEEFVRKYPPRPPKISPANPDESRQLTQADGVLEFQRAPAVATEKYVPRKKGDPGCHLWVFIPNRAPYILERSAVAFSLQSGVVKHTNLTGGGPASCGGEVWIDPVDDKRIYLNGGSGRYGPESELQLSDAAQVLADLGFLVESFGWDDDAGRPAMVRRP